MGPTTELHDIHEFLRRPRHAGASLNWATWGNGRETRDDHPGASWPRFRVFWHLQKDVFVLLATWELQCLHASLTLQEIFLHSPAIRHLHMAAWLESASWARTGEGSIGQIPPPLDMALCPHGCTYCLAFTCGSSFAAVVSAKC